jgi:metal-responsive CopG/Arc/MetJ family transcriptional regulator
MSVSVNIPEELYRQASRIAAEENISVDELFASAFQERVLEFERLKEEAAHGSYEKFLRVMSKVPTVEPPDYDRL